MMSSSQVTQTCKLSSNVLNPFCLRDGQDFGDMQIFLVSYRLNGSATGGSTNESIFLMLDTSSVQKSAETLLHC